MSMSDAALSQPDTPPSMVATRDLFCVQLWSRRVSEVSRWARQPSEFGLGTIRGVHEIVRGSAVNGVLWAGQHGGCQQRRSNFHVFGGSSEAAGRSTPPGGLKCLDEHASPEDRARRTADV